MYIYYTYIDEASVKDSEIFIANKNVFFLIIYFYKYIYLSI